MITILFWNIRKQPILHRVARIADRRSVDLLILAECDAPPDDVVTALNRLGSGVWNYPATVTSRLKIFSRLPAENVVEVFSTAHERLTIREVRRPNTPPLLLAAVHLAAKVGGWTDHSQSAVARPIAENIEFEEQRHQNPRTIVIGDFNMPPFAPGMIDGFVFHSLMTRDLANRRSARVVDGNTCRRAFFNPMWQFMRDRPGRPSGTYYWSATSSDNHYWYTLDQVLVRPELSDKLVNVDIIDHDGMDSLTTLGGWPDTEAASDHLPIVAILDV